MYFLSLLLCKIYFHKSFGTNRPLAIIEAKDNSHTIRAGIQQALGYANTLDIPFVFSSNGEGFFFHDKTSTDGKIEWALSLDDFPPPGVSDPGPIDGPMPEPPLPQRKIEVDGVPVKIINERVQYLDADGKIITESLTDYTKSNILKNYQSLDKFLTHWIQADKKKAILEELESQGVLFDALQEEVGSEWDPFDLICHVAFDAKPLTRKERVDNVKKRNYFTKYGKKAQEVLKSLLDKYEDEGLVTIENTEILKLDPFKQIGTPLELIRAFGSKEDYERALRELESELYKTGA